MTMLYEDILNLPHPTSLRHPRMPRANRAAQFAAFAALTGYEDVIRETARLTDARICLDEGELEVLDRSLRLLLSRIQEQPAVSVTFFHLDSKKAGGAYVTLRGHVRKYDEASHSLLLTDGTALPIEDILALDLL